jgi:hypothetical protein
LSRSCKEFKNEREKGDGRIMLRRWAEWIAELMAFVQHNGTVLV